LQVDLDAAVNEIERLRDLNAKQLFQWLSPEEADEIEEMGKELDRKTALREALNPKENSDETYDGTMGGQCDHPDDMETTP